MNRMSQQAVPPHLDRRSKSGWNRVRRFLNDYWLVPVVILYLQLLAAVVGAQGGTPHALTDVNRRVIAGVPALGRIITNDFPFTLIGHSKEMLHTLAGITQRISPQAFAARLRPVQEELYRSLWNSRSTTNSELGGVVSLSPQGQPVLSLIPSSNGRLMQQLAESNWQQGLAWLGSDENRELVNILTQSGFNLARVVEILSQGELAQAGKETLYEAALHTLEVTSQARYLLQPEHFKSYLGHMNTWRYVGLFHYHNQVATPPSEADVEASYRVRQFVLTLSPDGFDLHDISDGVATVTHFSVKDDAWVTQPQWHSLTPPSRAI